LFWTAFKLIKGAQSQGIGANVKYYAANNQENQRMGINYTTPVKSRRFIAQGTPLIWLQALMKVMALPS